MMLRTALSSFLALALAWAAPVAAQEDAPPPATPQAPAPARANWLSDRVELRPGDVVTVIIDERTSARERVSEYGTERRTLQADLSAVSDGESAMGLTGVDSRWAADSRQLGEAARQGDLYGLVTARVVSLEAGGAARIEGRKTVVIDGRKQEIAVAGLIRPNDLSPGNVVHSSRIAEAAIDYKGKKLGAKKGILGSILSILWPF